MQLAIRACIRELPGRGTERVHGSRVANVFCLASRNTYNLEVRAASGDAVPAAAWEVWVASVLEAASGALAGRTWDLYGVSRPLLAPSCLYCTILWSL